MEISYQYFKVDSDDPVETQLTVAFQDKADKSTSQNPGDPSHVEVSNRSRQVYEALHLAVCGKVPAKDVTSALHSATGVLQSEVRHHVADAFWLLALEIEAIQTDKPIRESSAWKALVAVVRAALITPSPPLLTRQLALERFPMLLVGDPALRLVTQEKKFGKTVVKTNTKMLYTQKKFNLLREETEGFAKVATLLAQATSSTSVETITNRITALIGNFCLAPNRVLDLTLDAFEAFFGVANAVYLGVLDMFPGGNIAQLLGFKFVSFVQRKQQAPRSLCKVAAFLISQSRICLQDIWMHLAPAKDKDFATAQKKQTRDMLKAARSFKMKSQDQSLPPDQRPKIEIDLFNVSPMSAEFTDLNCKIGLLVGFLDLGLWKDASALLQMFAKLGVKPAYDPRVAGALRGLLSRVVKIAFYNHIQSAYPPVSLAIVKKERTANRI